MSDRLSQSQIKIFTISFFKSLGIGIVAAICARLLVSPICGLLQFKKILSSDSVDLIYLGIGQIAGSLTFIMYLYKDLINHEWSKFRSILAVISSVIFLTVLGLLIYGV